MTIDSVRTCSSVNSDFCCRDPIPQSSLVFCVYFVAARGRDANKHQVPVQSRRTRLSPDPGTSGARFEFDLPAASAEHRLSAAVEPLLLMMGQWGLAVIRPRYHNPPPPSNLQTSIFP